MLLNMFFLTVKEQYYNGLFIDFLVMIVRSQLVSIYHSIKKLLYKKYSTM